MLATLGFLWLEGQQPPVLHALHRWLDSWPGVGAIVAGMAHHGYDVQLTRYDERGWRATFYPTGMEHSATSATGSAWEPAPWHATQRAAWEALRRELSTKREDTIMSPIEDKLIEAWRDFKAHAQTMGYSNQQNLNECLNGAGAFVDFLRGRQPRAGRSYATATTWPTA